MNAQGATYCPQCGAVYDNNAKICPKCSGKQAAYGDWICKACGARGVGKADVCSNCKKPLAQAAPGGWVCGTCRTINDASNAHCVKCGWSLPKPGAGGKLGIFPCWNCGIYQLEGTEYCASCKAKFSSRPAVKAGQLYCLACGRDVPEGTTVCPYCGNKGIRGKSMSIPVSQRHLHGLLFEPRPIAAPKWVPPLGSIPSKVDLREFCTPVEDQGQIGSCAANAVVGALEYHQVKLGQPLQDLSRLFVYYNARHMAGTENEDSGCYMSLVMAAAIGHGACMESLWPYDTEQIFVKPPREAFNEARNHDVTSFARVDPFDGCKAALANGLPVVFGCAIPQSFYQEASKTGTMPGPETATEKATGGHAMLIVGYDDAVQHFIVRNSWGPDWGDKGYVRIPYATLAAYSTSEDYYIVGSIEKTMSGSLAGPVSVKDAVREIERTAKAVMQEALGRMRAQRKALGRDVALRPGPKPGTKTCWKCGSTYPGDDMAFCPKCWAPMGGDTGGALGADDLQCVCNDCLNVFGRAANSAAKCPKCNSVHINCAKPQGPVGRSRQCICMNTQCGKSFELADAEDPKKCPHCGVTDAANPCRFQGTEVHSLLCSCPSCGEAWEQTSDKERRCPKCHRWDNLHCSRMSSVRSTPTPASLRGYHGAPLPTSARRLDGCLFERRPSSAPQLITPMGNTPQAIDLRQYMSPVEDQGQSNSCTANATVGALEYHQRRSGGQFADISRLFVYYNARHLANAQGQDCGSFIHHAMAAVLAHGACEEAVWPFDLNQVLTQPSQDAYKNGMNHEAVQYARTMLGNPVIQALAFGLPVVFGTYAPGRFYDEAQKTGVMPAVTDRGEQPGGGHAMLIVGYDLPSKTWLIRNSWGGAWADKGYFRMPFSTMEAYSAPDHFWAIGAIEGKQGLSLSGPSPKQAAEAARATAPGDVADALASLRGDLRSDFQAELDKQKQDIRNRLRNPDKT